MGHDVIRKVERNRKAIWSMTGITVLMKESTVLC